MLALDLGFADPCLPSLLEATAKTDLSAADNMGRRKMNAHTTAISELGRSRIHCDLLPITMEVSGAFGTQARRWWEKLTLVHDSSREIKGSHGLVSEFDGYLRQSRVSSAPPPLPYMVGQHLVYPDASEDRLVFWSGHG